MEEYKKAIRIKPLLSEARCGLAASYHRLGDKDSAIRELKEAIEINPKDGTLHYNLGKIYDEAQKYELAKREYENAIELNPNDYEAYHNLGKIQEVEGNTKKAVESYQRVIDLAPSQYASYVKQLEETIRRLTTRGTTMKWEEFRNSIFEKAYDQAISEYGSWEKYKKEQWKSSLYYGEEDLLDLALCLLSSGRRVKYPIPALDLAAYTIKKFNLDIRLANIPVVGMRFNTRTNENDPNQILSLTVKFDKVSEWQLHFGAHILARCALLSDNPGGYLTHLIQNMTPPHDIIVTAQQEFRRIIKHQCPYENEAEEHRTPINEALKEAMDFFYKEKSPSPKLRKEIETEVLIEKEIADISKGLR